MDNRICSKEKIIRNLQDAGCDDATIQTYFEALDAGEPGRAMQALEDHRASLLREFHRYADRIECLDYFIRQTEHGKEPS